MGSGDEDFFKLLDQDAAIAEGDAKAEANIVHGFDGHRSAVVPWLRRTAIEEHTRGLKKDEMHASFAVPKAAESEPELFLMLEVMDEIFIEAHSWCFDGPDCMRTWPRQLALSRFHTAVAPGQKTRAFDPKKEPNTLKTNFGSWKQFLTYSYRVAYRGDHFTAADSDQRTPESHIQLKGAQENAWEVAFRSAVEQDGPALRKAMSVLSIKHGLVMLHTTYHKGQQQTGKFKDNIRFLPAPIGDLLLDYLVVVVPLLQVFLRRSAPHALLSPYLWWQDGKVWADNRLTRCMEQACSRASVPRLHIANWRQMTVNIVKTKFAADVGCFEVDDGANDEDAEEIEADIRIMTKQRNHSTRTVNRAYANQHNANFGNVWDGLIRRNLRASTLWKDLWGLDQLLGPAGKRKRDGEDIGGPQMLKKIAMGVYRPRKKWSAAALLNSARKLYLDNTLKWKSAAQERAMTTIMSWTEQVVVIMATGEGKSLLFMLPCILPDAGVTILVLPLVSLRGELLRRVGELGIDYLMWLPSEQRDAPLVFVTVEAACTEQFRT